MTTELDERVDGLIERATEKLEMVTSKADEDDLGPVLSALDDLEDVADEAEDLLTTVDLTELAEAIDWEDLPEAVELHDLDEAIEKGEVVQDVSLRKLVQLSELSELWANTDARQAWHEKREFEDEVDDITDEDETPDESSLIDGSMPDAEGSMPDADIYDIDPESVENAIQSQVSDSVGEFREKLLEARERFKAIREENEDRFPDRRRRRSRNPTAVSTLPKGGSVTAGGPALHSTVPEETQHSTAPNRRRIYGTRFESAGGETDE